MHPDTFSTGDLILLVGEGNFSFAVGLVNLNLPITVTASCLESDVMPKETEENIAYLKQKDVRVLLDVDATKMDHHPVLKNEKFSKIIFNFPHTGGKMKIHLNRDLLKRFFISSSELIHVDGKILVSLCKGQGGTRADKPVRRWDDTWQVVEMAGHGDLVLVSVEHFRSDIFPGYKSVGYRGGNTAFHTDGALVHTFVKREPLYSSMEVDVLSQCLENQILKTEFGNLTCSGIYSHMYNMNPIQEKGSALHYLWEQLRHFVQCNVSTATKISCISDAHISLYTDTPTGGPVCYTKENKKCYLRHSLLDKLDEVFMLRNTDSDEIIMFPGMVFNELGEDFSCAPVYCHVLLTGHRVSYIVEQFCRKVLQLFKKDYMYVSVSNSEKDSTLDQIFTSTRDVVINSNGALKELLNKMQTLIAKEFAGGVGGNEDSSSVSVCVIYLNKLAELLFDVTNWRQLWVKKSSVILDKNIPVLKHACFESIMYTFDICFSDNPNFKEDKFYTMLWNMAADIIIDVKLLDVYESPDGWRSRCYRITYQSYYKALSRKKAIHIQENVIGKMLHVKFGVLIK
ncbi:ferredoxin-fold anticodon-binding domain-containing protein 1-like [Periplaneta americana]|uniref:ferredoxin-fold anticodon-binding domain-containing protein 1-like n=1 Tax=Periplaneta americana TaxID=6978 RepID=UPI0037E80919